eukprot:1218142-Prymnesium_polylepis.2
MAWRPVYQLPLTLTASPRLPHGCGLTISASDNIYHSNHLWRPFSCLGCRPPGPRDPHPPRNAPPSASPAHPHGCEALSHGECAAAPPPERC